MQKTKIISGKNMLFIVCISLLIFSLTNSSCTETDIYIVRHAEKDTVPRDNPPLTNKGQLRAEALAKFLSDKHIAAIYSTKTIRAISTAHPTADIDHLPVFIYDSIPPLIASLRLENHKNILIVGHSNTIIQIAEALDTHPTMDSIGDHDFDNLFIVRKRRTPFGNSTSIEETTYGSPSP